MIQVGGIGRSQPSTSERGWSDAIAEAVSHLSELRQLDWRGVVPMDMGDRNRIVDKRAH